MQDSVEAQPDSSDVRGLDPSTWVDDHGDYLYRYALLKLRGRVNEADQIDPSAVHRRFRDTAAS